MKRIAAAIGFSVLFGCSSGNTTDAAKEKSELASLAFRSYVEDHFKAQFEFYPSQATSHGFHEYDNRLEDYSAPAIRKRVDTLHSLRSRLQAVRAQKPRADELMDFLILEGQIRAELLDLEELRVWQTNPMIYVGLPGQAVDGLMKRNFAPPQERLRSVIARLNQIPSLLESMRANVQNPPKEFTDLALRMARGSTGFFRDDVSAWARQVSARDLALRKSFDAAIAKVVAAFEQTVSFIETDLAKRSKGEYAIGAQRFSRKLNYEEMVDVDLKKLLTIGEANLDKDYKAFVAVAARIDPSRSPGEVMHLLEQEHPEAHELVAFAQKTLENIRQFVVDKKIITIPSEVRPTITETPPYARSGTFASMDTPGAYERRAKEAFYYITPPESDWTRAHKEEHLRLFSRPVMDVITIHEVYPGHYVQFLYARQFPTRTRRLVSCGTNAEGWAHYAEQMMIEEGFGGNDPKLRLAQLQEALLRDCRYIAGIKLHTEGWTVEQAAKLFVQKAFQSPANAYEEARRGAYNPTYLYYTLGKLQIYKLREDYRRAKGGAYSLEKFHNEFIQQGAIPIKLIRQLLLNGDTSPSL